MTLSRSQSSILWLPVCALAAVHGAITLSWVIYNLHLPGLLKQFGFPAEFTPGLLAIEALLAIFLEPWFGSLSDQAEQARGNRFVLIAPGVVLSSLLLVAIPAVVFFVPPVGGMRWWLPGVLLAWAMAMTLFRSPALALLGRYAEAIRWPQAASLLTLAFGLASATRPLASQQILSLGPTLALIAAALVLLATAVALRATSPVVTAVPAEVLQDPAVPGKLSVRALALIAVIGLGVTLSLRIMIETFPKILKAQLPDVKPPLMVGVIFLALALMAIPAGALATRLGNRRTMLFGLVALAGLLGLMLFTQNASMALAVAMALGASFSLVSNGTLPLALSLVPPDRLGLAIGAFFAGVALATSLFVGVLGQPGVLSPVTAILIGIAALLVTGLCILATGTFSSDRNDLRQTLVQ